ncbi:MAG: phosphatase PAP2 family protein [Burkholderiaceae bacterium]
MFLWIAAGYEPNAFLLTLARWLAQGGGWLAFAGVAWALWRVPSRRGYLACAVVACGLAALASHELAALLNAPRPFMLGLSPLYVGHGARSGLPSTHATVLFTLAFICVQRPELRRIGLWVGGWALATGWGRVYCGLHFPLDIAAGMVLAAVIALAFHGAALAWIGLRRRVRRQRVAAPLRVPGPGPAAGA